MKWMFLGAIICCGGPLLLLILLGANAGLVLGLVSDNLLVFLLGLALIAIGVYYAWRHRYLKMHSQGEVSSSQIQTDKGRHDLEV